MAEVRKSVVKTVSSAGLPQDLLAEITPDSLASIGGLLPGSKWDGYPEEQRKTFYLVHVCGHLQLCSRFFGSHLSSDRLYPA